MQDDGDRDARMFVWLIQEHGLVRGFRLWCIDQWERGSPSDQFWVRVSGLVMLLVVFSQLWMLLDGTWLDAWNRYWSR
jgi:hypothetical protein